MNNSILLELQLLTISMVGEKLGHGVSGKYVGVNCTKKALKNYPDTVLIFSVYLIVHIINWVKMNIILNIFKLNDFENA